MRLIDADRFKEYITVSEDVLSLFKTEEFKQLTVSTMDAILKDIDEQPTIDAVEVVRCEDCKWCDTEVNDCHNPRFGNGWANYPPPTVREDFFCGDGERKDNERQRKSPGPLHPG